MTGSSFDPWIDRFIARTRVGEFLRRTGELTTLFLFGSGGIVLLSKLAVPQLWPHVLWVFAGLPLVVLAAWIASRQDAWSRRDAVARLDRALDTGGLLMTLSECPDDRWQDRLPQLQYLWQAALPGISLARLSRQLRWPLMFAVAASLVPLRETTSSAETSNQVGQQETAALENLMEELKAEAVLENEEEQRLSDEIKELAKETKSAPLSREQWEAVDALRERMKVRLEHAQMTTSLAREAARMLAESLDPQAPPLSPDEQAASEEKVAETLRKVKESLEKKGEQPKSAAARALQERLQRLSRDKDGKPELPADPETRQKVLDELQDYLDEESKKLSQMRKKCSGKKCDGQPADGEPCDNCQDGECEGECQGQGRKSSRDGSRPGRGGISRGRGDADLTFGDESDAEGSKFVEVVLPKGTGEDPDDEVLGVTLTAPNEDPAAAAERGAARSLDPATGTTTWNRKLSPRHRNVVRRYFDQK